MYLELHAGVYHEPRAAGAFLAGFPQESLGNVNLVSQGSLIVTPSPARRADTPPMLSPQPSVQFMPQRESRDGWGQGDVTPSAKEQATPAATELSSKPSIVDLENASPQVKPDPAPEEKETPSDPDNKETPPVEEIAVPDPGLDQKETQEALLAPPPIAPSESQQTLVYPPEQPDLNAQGSIGLSRCLDNALVHAAAPPPPGETPDGKPETPATEASKSQTFDGKEQAAKQAAKHANETHTPAPKQPDEPKLPPKSPAPSIPDKKKVYASGNYWKNLP